MHATIFNVLSVMLSMKTNNTTLPSVKNEIIKKKEESEGRNQMREHGVINTVTGRERVFHGKTKNAGARARGIIPPNCVQNSSVVGKNGYEDRWA